MKIYKFITQISIAGCMLVGTPMLQGCMDNSLNDPLGKVSISLKGQILLHITHPRTG